MKSYISIPKIPRYGDPVLIFAKYDGSCMRAEWDPKKGFTKFGRRNGLLDDSNPVLKEFPEIFLKKYGEQLHEIFKKQRFEGATCFAEFFGPNSFAGTHADEQHDCVLFDVSVYKKGFIEPREFIKLFKDLPVQELLYDGNFTGYVEMDIVNGKLPGMPPEGVVCKGSLNRKTGLPLMFKVKQKTWVERLKHHCNGDQKMFEELL